MLDKLI